MRRFVPALVSAVLAAAALAAAAAAVTPGDAKTLLRVASRLSGLDVRRAVPVVSEPAKSFSARRLKLLDRLYPPSAQSYDDELYAALGLSTRTGTLRKALTTTQKQRVLYDPVARKAYVQAGKDERDAILHELVHALQDQHFDLRRVELLKGRRDASLAAAAAVEGHSTLVAGVLGAGHGGRSAVYRDAEGSATVLIALDWDTPRDAAQWEEAVQAYVNEAFDADRPGFPATTPCAAILCWQIGAHAIVFRRDGGRTALALGPSLAQAASLAVEIVPSG